MKTVKINLTPKWREIIAKCNRENLIAEVLHYKGEDCIFIDFTQKRMSPQADRIYCQEKGNKLFNARCADYNMN